MAENPTDDMRRMVVDLVQSRRGEGSKRATDYAARELGITTSRVCEYLKNRVSRAWADEWIRAREGYARYCERQAMALSVEAERCRALAQKLQQDLPCKLSD